MPQKLACIDVGSNALRLLLCQIQESNRLHITEKKKLRIPLRLGEDTFVHHRISKEKEELLVESMKTFKHLMNSYGVTCYRACATSALRQASNGRKICERIREETAIQIEILDGEAEARLIFSALMNTGQFSQGSFLLADVGGGSTELALFSDQQNVWTHSFDIGTLRLLYHAVDTQWQNEFRERIKNKTAAFHPLKLIGTGGNIKKILNLAGSRKNRTVSFRQLKQFYDRLTTLTPQQRITVLALKPDRADVIVPAAELFLTLMQGVNVNKIFVPGITLADGLLHGLRKQQPHS
jgi:exopolyphosphatase/guanosine-5'-triphosphate,3'-diphosphate pyrophosphatase